MEPPLQMSWLSRTSCLGGENFDFWEGPPFLPVHLTPCGWGRCFKIVLCNEYEDILAIRHCPLRVFSCYPRSRAQGN